MSAEVIGTAADAPAPITAMRRGVVFAACAVACFADGYDVSALGLAIPRMATEFALPPSAFALATSTSLLGMAIGALTLSPLADRMGAGRALALILLLIGGSTLGAMGAGSATALAAWRFVSGLGLGSAVPVAIALTSAYAPPRWIAAVVTLMVSFTGIGALAAGFLAPVTAAQGGWRGIFALGAALPLIGAVLAGFMGETDSRRGLAGRGRRAGTAAPVSALLAPTFRRLTLLVWALFWLNLMVNYSLISWLPTLLEGAGWDRTAASRASGLIAIGGIAGGIGISAITDRSGSIAALATAYVMAAAALIAFAIAPAGIALWVVLLLVVGLSAFGAQISLSALTAIRYPPSIRATAAGWSSGLGRIGAFIGPLIVARLISAEFASGTIIGLLMVPMLCCAAAVMMLPRGRTATDHDPVSPART